MKPMHMNYCQFIERSPIAIKRHSSQLLGPLQVQLDLEDEMGVMLKLQNDIW